ncbi:MAG: phage tail protein [Nodosilinea sp. WJT8-NPBG4]|jgi:phage-related protein|nr:phage tail protein [Nodosilinea sp. WJT8-NPBG4]
MVVPVLTLDPSLNIRAKPKYPVYENQLGDGYTANEPAASNILIEWELSAVLTKAESDSVSADLTLYNGFIPFQWQPYPTYPKRTYVCKEWKLTSKGTNGVTNIYAFSATFLEDSSGACLELLDEFSENDILDLLDGADLFLFTYTRNTLPFLLNANSISVNSFHPLLKKGSYLPASSGTTLGQALGSKASLAAYQQTNDVAWLNRAVAMAQALIANYYRGATIPLQGAENTLFMPHRLINVKEPLVSKGTLVNPPLNSGHFSEVFTFTNGVATIPGGLLSNVYKVYSLTGRLLWNYVKAPVISGTEYVVSYWVSNYELNGTNYAMNKSSESITGDPFLQTAEPAGKVVLQNTSFNGNLIVVYSDYSGETIGTNTLFEIDPITRPLVGNEVSFAFDAAPYLYEAFTLLASETEDTSWARAAAATRYTTIQNANVQATSYFYKKEVFPDPLRWPGSQIFYLNNANGGSTSRVTFGDKTDWLQINSNLSATPLTQATEFQNASTIVTAFTDSTITVEAESSVGTVLTVTLSTSANTSAKTDLYSVYLVLLGDILRGRTYNIREFIRWSRGPNIGDVVAGGDQYLVWHPRISDNPVYTLADSESVVSTYLADSSYKFDEGTELEFITDVLVSRIELTRRVTAKAGLILIQGNGASFGAQAFAPPKVVLKVSGTDIRLVFTDAADNKFAVTIPATGEWTEYNDGWLGVTAVEHSFAPNTGAQIKAIEFEVLTSRVTAVIDVFYVGNAPLERLNLPSQIYKGVITSNVRGANSLFIGDFKQDSNPLDLLLYSPGIWPATATAIDGVVEAWTGEPYTGYQNPHIWLEWGVTANAQNVFNFLAAAQEAYVAQVPNSQIGPFAPVFNWASWDTLSVRQQDINKFSWLGADPNVDWSVYQFRALEAAAKAWTLVPTNPIAQKLVMRFLTFLNNNYYGRLTLKPLTTFDNLGGLPFAESNDPQSAALLLKTAIYANLAGGNENITFPLILHCYRYLKSEYINTGVMAGSFAKSQSTFTQSSIDYKEYYFNAHMEVVDALSLLNQYRNELTVPPCGLIYLDGRASELFDATFYLATYSDVQPLIASGTYADAYDHYLKVGQSEGRFFYFDEEYYLATYREIQPAIDAGLISPVVIDHWFMFGIFQGRRPHPF